MSEGNPPPPPEDGAPSITTEVPPPAPQPAPPTVAAAPEPMSAKQKRLHLWTQLSNDKHWPKIVAGGINGISGRMMIDKIVAAYNDSVGRLHLVDNGMSTSRKAWRCCSVPRQRRNRVENGCQYCHVARRMRVRTVEELRKNDKNNIVWDPSQDSQVDVDDVWILSRPVEHTCAEKPGRKQGRRQSAYTSKIVATALLHSAGINNACKGNAEAAAAFKEDLQGLALESQNPLASTDSLTSACVARARKQLLKRKNEDDVPALKTPKLTRKVSVFSKSAATFKELVNSLGPDFPINLDFKKTEIPEITGKLEDVAREKCMAAYREVKGPVLVEVTSLAINSLAGLPGTQASSFAGRIGSDGINKMVDSMGDKSATASVAYALILMKGDQPVIFIGEHKGQIVPPRVATSEPDWDNIFQPVDAEGDLTYAEMGDRKLINSHRSRAIADLKDHIDQISNAHK